MFKENEDLSFEEKKDYFRDIVQQLD